MTGLRPDARAVIEKRRHLCPLCDRFISRPHFKRHLWKHDREGVTRAESDRAWLAFLGERTAEAPALNETETS